MYTIRGKTWRQHGTPCTNGGGGALKSTEWGDGVTAPQAPAEEGETPKGSPHAKGEIWREEGVRRAGEQRCPHLSTMTQAMQMYIPRRSFKVKQRQPGTKCNANWLFSDATFDSMVTHGPCSSFHRSL